MSHELAELHFPLPAAPSATFTSLWIGNETRFQEVPPLPKRAPGETAAENGTGENPRCRNTPFCAFSRHDFGVCAWATANV